MDYVASACVHDAYFVGVPKSMVLLFIGSFSFTISHRHRHYPTNCPQRYSKQIAKPKFSMFKLKNVRKTKKKINKEKK